MLIRCFWKATEINELQTPNEDSVVIRRTLRGGLLTSDAVCLRDYHSRAKRNRNLRNAIAYIEVETFRENELNENNILPNTWQQIVIDTELSDTENSKTISDSLGLTNNGQSVFLQNYNVCLPSGNRPIVTGEVIPNNLIVNYSAWAVIHNKLMIMPNSICNNGYQFYSCNINEPLTEDREYIYINYPNYIACDWFSKWSVVVSRNNRLEIIKSFNKYTVAQKSANKYLRRITGDRRLPVHNFRSGEFSYVTEHGDQIVVKAYKEKELL